MRRRSNAVRVMPQTRARRASGLTRSDSPSEHRKCSDWPQEEPAVNPSHIAALCTAILVASAATPETTVIRGRVLTAVERSPIVGAIIRVAGDSAITDSAGAYELRANRASTWLGVRKDGFLDFEHPLLKLTTDTLTAVIELRSDPPSTESYAAPRFLPFLCVRADDAAHLDVTNSCQWPTFAGTAYVRRIIKH